MFSATPKPKTKSGFNTPYHPKTPSTVPGGLRFGVPSSSLRDSVDTPPNTLFGSTLRQKPAATPFKPFIERSRQDLHEQSISSTVADTPLPRSSSQSNIFSFTDTHSVVKLESIPPLVFKTLVSNQWDQSNVSATIDHASGYVAISLPDRCYLWHSNRLLSSSTSFNQVLEFSLTRLEASVQPLLVSFIPSPLGEESQPGLVLCSRDGVCRLWDNIVFGVNAYSETHVPISQDDSLSHLHFTEPQGCVIGTNRGGLFYLSLWDLRGSSVLKCTAFSRSHGVLSRVTSLFGYSRDQEMYAPGIVVDSSIQGLVALNQGPSHHFLFVLSETKLQKWSLAADGTSTLLNEEVIIDAVKSYLDTHDESNMLNLSVRLEDISYSNGEIVIMASASEQKQLWGHFILFMKEERGSFIIISFKQITELERKTDDLHKPSRLLLLHEKEADVVFAIVPDKICICLADLHNTFEEAINFSSSTLVGYSTHNVSSVSGEVTLNAVSLDQHGGLLSITVNHQAIKEKSRVKEITPEQSTQSLRSRIEQAVHFGGAAEWINPIAFDLSNCERGDLSTACLDVSKEILDSSSEFLRSAVDVKADISERSYRLEQLIAFLNANHAVENLQEQTRIELRSHGEKLAAGLALWNYLNDILSNKQDLDSSLTYTGAENTLELCIQNFMNNEDDFTRNFFKFKLGSLRDFLASIVHIFDSPNVAASKSHVVEANKIIVTTLLEAYTFRQEYSSRYGLQFDSNSDLWTGSAQIIHLLESQYERTELALKDVSDIYPTINRSQPNVKNQLRNQLADIGDLLLGSLHERVMFLSTLSSREREFNQTKEQNQRNHERVFGTLASNQCLDQAFQLAEKYQNHKALVDLILRSTEPGTSPDAHRIRRYTQDFGAEFSNCFFDAMIKAGKYLDLLTMHESYNGLLDGFFSEEKVGWLSWIHDFRLGNFNNASGTLMGLGDGAKYRTQQNLAFSLSKLAMIESLDDYEAFAVSNANNLFQRELEFVKLQRELAKMFEIRIEEYKSTRATSRTHTLKFGLEDAIQVIYDKYFAENLRGRPVQESLVRISIKKMLNGEALSKEDVIDFLTLQCVKGEAAEYWVGAMELLIRYLIDVKPDVANFYLHSTWRRTWLSERWDQIREKSKTCSDTELRSIISSSNIFLVIQAIYSQSHTPAVQSQLETILLPPDRINLDFAIMPLQKRYPDLDAVTLSALQNEIETEQGKFLELNHEARLTDFWNECCRVVEEGFRDQLETMSQHSYRV